MSTYHVYKIQEDAVGEVDKINEKSKTAKKNLYTHSKIIGEKKISSIKEKKTKILIIRSCNLFGYPRYKNKNCWRLFINSMIKDLILKNEFTLKSKMNNFRVYSSMESFCFFISNNKKPSLTLISLLIILFFKSPLTYTLESLWILTNDPSSKYAKITNPSR